MLLTTLIGRVYANNPEQFRARGTTKGVTSLRVALNGGEMQGKTEPTMQGHKRQEYEMSHSMSALQNS